MWHLDSNVILNKILGVVMKTIVTSIAIIGLFFPTPTIGGAVKICPYRFIVDFYKLTSIDKFIVSSLHSSYRFVINNILKLYL